MNARSDDSERAEESKLLADKGLNGGIELDHSRAVEQRFKVTNPHQAIPPDLKGHPFVLNSRVNDSDRQGQRVTFDP
ncbi:hypothetical protein ACQEVM_37245 [Streptomyces sp. CA-243310]|uniref:hypothetical protein n=1 Tax=Streptomyces sp. CA-243310 TaxID=3240056 RepID=UPI003D93B0A5